jgi:hypothetical protein
MFVSSVSVRGPGICCKHDRPDVRKQSLALIRVIVVRQWKKTCDAIVECADYVLIDFRPKKENGKMEYHIYSSSEVPNLLNLDPSREALSTWPAVTLLGPRLTQILDWTRRGDIAEKDIEDVTRLRIGFRTEWGV